MGKQNNDILEPGDKRLTDAQQILLKISRNIIGTLDYEKVLQIICDGMSELLDIETGAIYLLESNQEISLGATTPPLDSSMPDEFRKAKLSDHPHIQKAVTLKIPQTIFDFGSAELSPAEQVIVTHRKMKSLLFFPFVQKENVLGVMILGTSNKTRIFERAEIDLGQTIANQLSIGILNARLHYDLQLKNNKLENEIKERKKTEQALRTSETHLSNALRIAKLGHWEYDLLTDQFTFTDEFFELFHTSPEEIGGYTLTSQEYATLFVHPDDQHLVANEIKKAIESTNKNYSNQMEHRMRYANGEEGYLMVRYKIEKNKNNQTVKVYGVNQDVTEQVKSQRELKNHRDNLEQLVKDKTMKLDCAIEELKATNEELYQKNQIINTQVDELQQAIIDLKDTQAKLIQSEKMASLGILTAGIAHEINNPLNYIMGSYLALDDFYNNSQVAQKPEQLDIILDSLKSGVDKATNIVKGLNQFSRNNVHQNEECEIHSVIENCLSMLGNQINNSIEIERQFAPHLLNTKGNIGQIHQALMNIIINAVQAVEDKGKVTIKTASELNNLILEIKDNGLGIDRKDLSKVTDPFFTTKDPGKGIGLGLSIAYSIIEDHRGSMEIESEKGKGTSIIIKLPMANQD